MEYVARDLSVSYIESRPPRRYEAFVVDKCKSDDAQLGFRDPLISAQ